MLAGTQDGTKDARPTSLPGGWPTVIVRAGSWRTLASDIVTRPGSEFASAIASAARQLAVPLGVALVGEGKAEITKGFRFGAAVAHLARDH
jgi:hypothetical protein